jgi:hypothetical protein
VFGCADRKARALQIFTRFFHYTAQLNSIENLEGEPIGIRRYQSFYQRKKPRVDYCHLAILSERIDAV